MKFNDCQSCSLRQAAEGTIKVAPSSPGRGLKLFLSRRLPPQAKRTFKIYTIRLIKKIARLTGRYQPSPPVVLSSTSPLKSGDWVRVRSKEEIQATLNVWHELRGCAFMPEMETYCGASRRVLKRVERFLDERDYQVRRCNGVVLLEGIICSGTTVFGPCDRCCFFFWREEWLEKINKDEL